MNSIHGKHVEAHGVSHTVTQTPDPNKFRLHTHSSAEIYYFIRGGGIFHIEGSAYSLEPGDLLLMQPAESHYIELDCSQTYERKLIHFDLELLRPLDPQGLLLEPFFHRPPGKQNLYKPFLFRGGSPEHYFDTMLSGVPEPRVSVYAGLVPLLQELCLIRSRQTREEPQLEQDTLAYRILRYLNDNLTRSITLADVCRDFFISRSQLCRIFREATGVTVKHYLTVKRLVYARQRIEAGEPATHVYLQCGFRDYSSFYRAYVKHYGLPPTGHASGLPDNPKTRGPASKGGACP